MPPLAPRSDRPPGPFVTIPAFFFSSSPRHNYFARFPQARCPCAKVPFWGLREGAFPECLRAYRVALVPRRFAWDGAISAFSLPYLVILIRSPCPARSTNSSNLLFASVSPTVSMTLYSCKSGTKLGWTQIRQQVFLDSLGMFMQSITQVNMRMECGSLLPLFLHPRTLAAHSGLRWVG